MSVRIIIGDAREKLAELPDESVHCVVTSPPYFGLRDYGTASWEGGDPACNHMRDNIVATTADSPGVRKSTLNCGTEYALKTTAVAQAAKALFVGTCGKCGATRTDKQIGLEPTPAEFVAVMVEVFREVRRVLRKDGTLFLNLGDSYAGGGGHSPNAPSSATSKSGKYGEALKEGGIKPSGLIKQKDLIGIPWMVAFALRADGWYLRQDIIWAKPNPMPESVSDRCTKAHEYLFLLSKSARYHYDAEAIAEASIEAPRAKEGFDGEDAIARKTRGYGNYLGNDATRNRRSVWTVATQPFKEAHFATFPPDLIEPCIKAGCPRETCKTCGMAWRMLPAQPAHYLDGIEVRPALPARSECGHDTPGGPSGTVLDPFGGAGTTGLVADRLQRNAILIELNPEYIALAGERITDDAPLFAEVTA